jgi:hypothetical protein
MSTAALGQTQYSYRATIKQQEKLGTVTHHYKYTLMVAAHLLLPMLINPLLLLLPLSPRTSGCSGVKVCTK